MEFHKWKKAIALKYSEDMDAPNITALGKGLTARKIIETAKELDIPVIEDYHLTEALSNFNTGDEIPPELFKAVAEIYAFLFSMDKKAGENKNES